MIQVVDEVEIFNWFSFASSVSLPHLYFWKEYPDHLKVFLQLLFQSAYLIILSLNTVLKPKWIYSFIPHYQAVMKNHINFSSLKLMFSPLWPEWDNP